MWSFQLPYLTPFESQQPREGVGRKLRLGSVRDLCSQLGFPELRREASAPENVAFWCVSSLPRLAWASWRLQKQTSLRSSSLRNLEAARPTSSQEIICFWCTSDHVIDTVPHKECGRHSIVARGHRGSGWGAVGWSPCPSGALSVGLTVIRPGRHPRELGVCVPSPQGLHSFTRGCPKVLSGRFLAGRKADLSRIK